MKQDKYVWEANISGDWNASVEYRKTAKISFGILCLRKGTKKMFEQMVLDSLDIKEWIAVCKDYIAKSEKV